MFGIKNQVIKLFGKIFLLLLIVIAFDQLIGTILHHFYFKQVAGSAYRTTYSIDSTKADILVFGSSRANHHYVPEVFENGLKMSFYNTGRDGNFILYNYAVFKAVLSRYTPKIIVFDINPDELYFDPISYERLSSLLPYYANHPEIGSIVNLRSPFERFKLLSAIYPFNSDILTIGIGTLEINKNRKPDNKGYVPLIGIISDYKLLPISVSKDELDSIKFNALDSISKICFEKNINLFLCYSPIFSKTVKTRFDTLIMGLAEKRLFKYYNFSNDTHFIKYPDLFFDISHLNNDGAIKYSSVVVDSLYNTFEAVQKNMK